jgi:hypothetical protein
MYEESFRDRRYQDEEKGGGRRRVNRYKKRKLNVNIK